MANQDEEAVETRFWSIVDRDGLTGLPSDMWAALELRAARPASPPSLPSEALIAALRKIAHLRPPGDVDTCKSPRKLVEQMERIALAALAARPAPETPQNDNAGLVKALEQVRADVFAILREANVDEELFAAVAAVTYAPIKAARGEA